MKTIIYYDFEATSVARNADPISLGIVAVTEKYINTLDIFNIKQMSFDDIRDKNKRVYFKSKEFDFVLWEFYNKPCTNKEGIPYFVIHQFYNSPNHNEDPGVINYKSLDKNGKLVILNTLYNRFTDFKFDSIEEAYNFLLKFDDIKIVEKEVKTFYAEFTDFNSDKADDWVNSNIIDRLQLDIDNTSKENRYNKCTSKGNTQYISNDLKEWLSQFEEIEFWADFDVIDKPMLIDLIAKWDTRSSGKYDMMGNETWKYNIGLPKHPDNVAYYDFYDLHTLLKDHGIDPDINREEFAFGDDAIKGNEGKLLINVPIEFAGLNKHNPLWDAYVSWKCYEKLITYGNK